MKRVFIILLVLLLLTGCKLGRLIIEEDMGFTEEDANMQNHMENEDLLKNYQYLDEGLKNQLRELHSLWKKFDNGKSQDIDPSEDFHNSEYKAELKKFLGQKESLAVSGYDLARILDQPGYMATDKAILLSNGKEFNIRVISYLVDYYVQAITDFVGLKNNLIFVKCWNDDEFYFTVVSDGDIHTAYDFFPLEVDGELHIILTGKSFPYYPQPPFLWDLKFDTDGFTKGDLFDFGNTETKKYYIYNNVDFDKNKCLTKWTFQTDGSFMTVGRSDESNQPSELLRVNCEVLEDGQKFLFTGSDNINEIKPDIQIVLKNKAFVIQ